MREHNTLKRFNMSVDVAGMRKPYKGEETTFFTEEQLVSKEPFEQFRDWFENAVTNSGLDEPNAMCLATATKDGRPSARMVLMKGYGPDGFKFFTNYTSRKATELEDNPYAALNFHWESLKRCIRIEGRVEKMEEEEATKYFDIRPESSRIGAIISPQSQPIAGRSFLTEKEQELTQKSHEDSSIITKPSHWGGYIVIPETVEFWQGQTNRLHDRIRFRKLQPDETPDNQIVFEGENGWVYERLAP